MVSKQEDLTSPSVKEDYHLSHGLLGKTFVFLVVVSELAWESFFVQYRSKVKAFTLK